MNLFLKMLQPRLGTLLLVAYNEHSPPSLYQHGTMKI